MNDQGEEMLARVRAVLSDAGEEIATGSEGVHPIRHARGVVGWLPEDISPPPGGAAPAAAAAPRPTIWRGCGTPSASPWPQRSAQPA
ncbi:hypothetical protein ACWGE1_20760 [Streptomyces sp. NPDC054932]